MPDPADSIDITTDLNGMAPDAQPYHGDAALQNAPPAQTQPEVAKPVDDKPAPSLRDTLSDAFKGTEAPKVPEAAKAPEAAPAGAIPDLVKVGERFHRRDGGFASREEIDAFTRGQAPAGQILPPQLPQWADGLTVLEKEQFTALPAEIRQFVERTMDAVNNRGSQYQEYGMLEQVLGPRRQAWAQEGMTAPVAINQLFALSDFAGRDPGEFVLWFADQHRLDLDALLDAREAQAQGNGRSDPVFLGLQNQIEQLKNTINGFTTDTAQQRQAQNFQVVTAFANEKDASGKPLRPYFNDLATPISDHVALIRQQQPYLPERDVLQAAYDFAAYNNPAIRERMQQEQTDALREKAVQEAARARSAAVSINGGPAGDTSQLPNNANRTLRDELQHAFQQAHAGE